MPTNAAASTSASLPTAGDWMTTSVPTLAPDQDLFEAINLLLEHRLAAAPVVDREGKLLAMLTEKDCLRVLSHLVYGNDPKEGLVEDYQSPIRVVVEQDMDLFRAAEMFLSTNFPLLPVVCQGKLCGVISRYDMLRGVQAFRREQLKLQRKREAMAGSQADRPRSIESMQRTAANQSRDQMVRLFKRNAAG